MNTIITEENTTIRKKKKKLKKPLLYNEERLLIFSRQVDYLRKPSSLTIARYLSISLAFR